MSALAGFYHLDGRPADRSTVEQMTDRLAHRGPDGEGHWCAGPVGLGHRMLWTTPESIDEQLPLIERKSGLTLTADARIDNREELMAALGLRDRPSAEIADSELILQAYRKWGERCPERFIGAFAFALWDGREQRLFCARDPFGIKTLYYFQRPGRLFAFASEIKALFCLEDVPRRLDETRVADYLESLVVDKAITFYRDIHQIPPAHSLSVTREGLKTREYWALDPSREIRYGSDEEYAEAFREVFTEAVRCRLRSAFPIGSSLSGGLDSSSIVCVTRRLLRDAGRPPLHTFTAIFDDLPQCDEREYAQHVLDGGHVRPHFIHLDRLSTLKDIERVLWHQDQPLFVRNMFLWTAKYERARQEGVRVVLDGEDGDTIVSHGDGYLTELARSGDWAAFEREANGLLRHFQTYHTSTEYWLRKYGYPYLKELARSGRWIAFASAVDKVSRRFEVSRWKLLREQGLKPVIPDALMRLQRRVRGYPPGTDGKSYTLLDPDFARRIGFEERRRKLEAQYTPTRTLREGQWQGLTVQSPWAYEEIDKAAAAYSVEARHPFHDRRVVEFCLALPPEQKLHQGWPRWILRRAMEGILPDAIRWRTDKSNLGPNFDRSLLDFERERLKQLLVDDPSAIAEYVNLSVVRKAYEGRYANYVWPPAVLALWLRQTNLSA